MSAQQLRIEATSDLDREALAWLADHPEIYDLVVELARRWTAAGHRQCGIGFIWERMRWDLGVRTGRAPELNNSYRAVVAREVMKREPDLAGFFRTRTRKAGAG